MLTLIKHFYFVGVNQIGKVPSEVAEFLKLPETKMYTGHCFRRTSATLLVNGGGDILQLKRHGGWRSNNVAEGYIDGSIQGKLDTAQKILQQDVEKICNRPSTSTSAVTTVSTDTTSSTITNE